MHTLLTVAVDYLNSHLNYGVFTGVTGANLDVVMKLDLGVQITHIINFLVLGNGENALEAYLKSTEINFESKEVIFSTLIKWTIINYTGSKTKSSPAG